jgi:hypothetical protein
MGPRMWRIYTTNLTGSFINDIDVIPQDRITCLYNIRVLTIDERAEECSRDSRLASLLHLLRDNQLLEFNNATERPLHMKLFFHLLRHQSNLKSLRVRLDMSSAVDEDTTLWSTELTFLLTSALSSLKTLRIYIGDDSGSGHQENNLYKHEMAFDNILMQRACRLDELEICGWRWQGMRPEDRVRLQGLFEHTKRTDMLLQSTRSLTLAGMDLSGAGSRLLRTIDVLMLSVLRLEYCDRLGCLLQDLAACFRSQPSIQLRVLTVRETKRHVPDDDVSVRGAMEDLLCSFTSLEELECSFLLAPYINWNISLSQHTRIRKLHVWSALMNDGFPEWAEKVAAMLSSCGTLQYLAYSPPRPNLGKIIDCELPSTLRVRLYESLDVVATAPCLHKLRLLYAPGHREDELNRENPLWIDKAAQVAHRLATLILTHLRLKGSNIRLLALSPESTWVQRSGDSNLHFYPHYYYRLHTSRINGRNDESVIPWRDYVAEHPDSRLFF